MIEFSTLLQQGAGNAWLFIPSAILLGALHGLEPGHSKTMMAAFIIAIRGTVMQAVMLGIAATISHTAVVWLVALTGLYFGQHWDTEVTESYFQLGSGLMIIGVAVWMLWRTWHDQHHSHHHGHEHDEKRTIHTGHGLLEIEIHEKNVPPRFRISRKDRPEQLWRPQQLQLSTIRPGGNRQDFTLAMVGDYLESVEEIPEPHEFEVWIQLNEHGHHHTYQTQFTERGHEHDELDLGDDAEDAHAKAHADDIRRRFTNRKVSNGQIILFGLTGGLIPCPASITVLLLCLQLKKIALGATLVLCFSIGLALTMVMSGVIAALSVNHLSKRWNGFGDFARKAPYFSGTLILFFGLYIAYAGIQAIFR